MLLLLLQLFIILNVKTIIFGDLNEYTEDHEKIAAELIVDWS